MGLRFHCRGLIPILPKGTLPILPLIVFLPRPARNQLHRLGDHLFPLIIPYNHPKTLLGFPKPL